MVCRRMAILGARQRDAPAKRALTWPNAWPSQWSDLCTTAVHMLPYRALTLLFVASTGCATDPGADDVTHEWPCGSIQTGGHFGLANIHARYEYDALDNVVWRQETNYEEGPNYGKVTLTESKVFDGNIAIAEELVATNWHTKTTGELLDGRLVRQTFTQYGFGGNSDSIRTGTWTYDGDRVTRIDYEDMTSRRPTGYSVFAYPDDNTQVKRYCWFDDHNGGERCSVVTLIGGADTWTTRLTDDTADGVFDLEETRTLDANGLPTTVEMYSLPSRRLENRTVIERRADGAPLFMDSGWTQTEYLFACE